MAYLRSKMPTLELPNLAQYDLERRRTPPPIAVPAGSPIGPVAPAATACPPCYTGRQPNFNLVCQLGQTLTVGMKLIVKDINGVIQPVDITGNWFQYTAKTDINLPDTDPSVIIVNWQETSVGPDGTPYSIQGITSLEVPSNVTSNMSLVPYYYQVRMVSAVTSPSPIVTPLFSGTQIMTQPVSPRFS